MGMGEAGAGGTVQPSCPPWQWGGTGWRLELASQFNSVPVAAHTQI